MTVAIGCRLFADVCWWWLEGVQHQEPFPGISDIGYVAFYPFLLVGLLLLVRSRGASFRDRALDGLDVLVIGASAFVGVWYFVLGPVVETTNGQGLAAILNVYYPVADVVLVVAAARVMVKSSTRPRALVLLLCSCVLLVAADTAFPYLSEPGSPIGGEWVDLLWVSSCVVLAAAVDARRRTALAVVSVPVSRPPSTVPLFAVLGAGVVLVVAVVHLPAYPVLATAVGVVAVMSVTAVRQMIANREYAHLATRYRLLATRDALTGVMSRGEGIAQGQALLMASAQRLSPCGVLMLDMNHFKQVNDNLGHPAGDVVLAAVAGRISRSVRDQDLVCRYGGDEFLVILPGADEATTEQIAARIEEGVAVSPVCVGPHMVPVSVTVGAASDTGGALATLIHTADDALMTHKNRSRSAALGPSSDTAALKLA